MNKRNAHSKTARVYWAVVAVLLTSIAIAAAQIVGQFIVMEPTPRDAITTVAWALALVCAGYLSNDREVS